MGVYIDMEVPKSCTACFVREARCPAIRKRVEEMNRGVWIPSNYRHDDCPLVPVPPHGRLIDADELESQCDEPYWCVWRSDIDAAPTIIPAEEGEKNV